MFGPRLARRTTGFTLIEILISVVILSIGIVGILALHTATAIQAASVAAEGYVSQMARSIDAAIAEGVRQRAFVLQEGTGSSIQLVRGFLIRCEGVGAGATMPSLPTVFQDDASGDALQPLSASDFSIFMPTIPPGSSGSTPDPYYVFPRPTTAAAENPRVSSGTLTNGTDDWTSGTPGYNGTVYLNVQRVYQLNFTLPTDANNTIPMDAGNLYGWALTVRRAQVPSLGASSSVSKQTFVLGSSTGPTYLPFGTPTSGSAGFLRQDGLYEVEVQIYRAFDPSVTSPNHIPIRTFRTNIAVGP